jgi:hypothetical protein
MVRPAQRALRAASCSMCLRGPTRGGTHPWCATACPGAVRARRSTPRRDSPSTHLLPAVWMSERTPSVQSELSSAAVVSFDASGAQELAHGLVHAARRSRSATSALDSAGGHSEALHGWQLELRKQHGSCDRRSARGRTTQRGGRTCCCAVKGDGAWSPCARGLAAGLGSQQRRDRPPRATSPRIRGKIPVLVLEG